MKESIVLLLLGACWAGYLAWYWRDQRRSPAYRRDGIRSFAAGMGTLGGSAGRAGAFSPSLAPLAPRTSADAARRRREVFTCLGVTATITFFAAVGIGGAPIILLHLLIDVALVAYAYAVVQRRNAAAEREIKVQMLHPELAIVDRPRRVVNG